MVIFGEVHLRRILSAYAAYYNQARAHLALQKVASLHRAMSNDFLALLLPFRFGLAGITSYGRISIFGKDSSSWPRANIYATPSSRNVLPLAIICCSAAVSPQ